MNKKILVTTLLALVMLTTPLLIGAVQAGYGGKNVAEFDWEVQVWALNRGDPPPEDTRLKIIEKKDGNMQIGKNIHTIGVPPLVDDVLLVPGTPILLNPVWDDYPDGGIRLTITPEGEDSYTLLGSVEKTFNWIVYIPKGGMLENARWSFEITAVEDGDAPDDAVGSTMYGTLKNVGGIGVVKSTKGTGIFEGAFLRGTQTTGFGLAFDPSRPGVNAVFTFSPGSGEIVFP